jgi:hypothetical protein
MRFPCPRFSFISILPGGWRLEAQCPIYNLVIGSRLHPAVASQPRCRRRECRLLWLGASIRLAFCFPFYCLLRLRRLDGIVHVDLTTADLVESG